MPRFPSPRLDRVLALLEEQNALLRTVVAALGIPHPTPPTPRPSRRYTDADVTVVTRQTRIAEEMASRTAQQAPWRTPAAGQASGMTLSSSAPGSEGATPDLGMPRTPTR